MLNLSGKEQTDDADFGLSDHPMKFLSDTGSTWCTWGSEILRSQSFRSRPGKSNQRKGQNEKFMKFAHFCELCFSLGKPARFTSNFCSSLPPGKVHELAFLWFALPGLLLNLSGVRKRSFRKGVLGGACVVFPGTFLFASETEKEYPKELRDKGLFRNAFSERSKRLEKEHAERSLRGAPGPCSQVRPFLLAELTRDAPRNFDLRIRPPCTGAKIPKIRKRGFRSRKTPISPHPRNGRFESKNPHFPCGALYGHGDFLTRSTLFWGGGKWGFFDSETLFS